MTDELETRRFDSADAFRAWLRQHQDSSPGVWLTLAKKGSLTPNVTYAEALGVALEYGWIDGLAHRLDGDAYLQRFTPRRPRSPWSARNRRRVEAMIEAGTMAPRGLAEVERAMANGRWEAADAGTTARHECLGNFDRPLPRYVPVGRQNPERAPDRRCLRHA